METESTGSDLTATHTAQTRRFDQAWYWTNVWQKKEVEAEQDIAANRITGPFSAGKMLIRSLKRKRR